MSNKDLTMVNQYKMEKHRAEVVSLEVFVCFVQGQRKEAPIPYLAHSKALMLISSPYPYCHTVTQLYCDQSQPTPPTLHGGQRESRSMDRFSSLSGIFVQSLITILRKWQPNLLYYYKHTGRKWV